jgi:hypothetical protein
MAYVDGMGGVADAKDAIARAVLVVAARYPIGTAYGPQNPYLGVTGYRGEGVAEDSNAVRVRILYSTPDNDTSAPPGGTPWTIEDDSGIQETSTSLDPKTGKPLRVVWKNPKNKSQVIDDIVTLSYPQLYRRVVMTAILPADRVAELREAQRSTNDVRWSGLSWGFWRYTRMGSQGIIPIVTNAGLALGIDATVRRFRRVTVELDTMVDIDWSTYGILRDRRDGKFKCDDADAAKFRSQHYEYGTQAGNGVIKVGFLPEKNFYKVFGISNVDDL